MPAPEGAHRIPSFFSLRHRRKSEQRGTQGILELNPVVLRKPGVSAESLLISDASANLLRTDKNKPGFAGVSRTLVLSLAEVVCGLFGRQVYVGEI